MKRLLFGYPAVLVGLAVLSFGQAKPGAAGHWEGAITLPTLEVKVILDLDRDAKGVWIGSIQMPIQGIKDLPLRDIAFSGDALSFGIPGGQGNPTFKGKLADGVFSGEFSQAGNTAPFTFKRTGDAVVAAAVPIAAIPEKFTGKWEGKLEVPTASVRLEISLVNKDNFASGAVDSPEQGVTGIPVADISVNENAIKITVKVIAAEYNGKLSEDGKTLTGQWTQGGNSFSLVLTKK